MFCACAKDAVIAAETTIPVEKNDEMVFMTLYLLSEPEMGINIGRSI